MHRIKEKFKNILLRIQNRIHIDMFYLARGTFWLSTSFILTSILSLVQVIIFANFLPKEAYGNYKYILTLAGSLVFLTLTGMNTAVVQAAVKNSSTAILQYAVRVQIRWAALYSVAMVGLATYYFLHDNTLFAKSLLILAIAIPLDTIFNTYGPFLEGRRDFRRSSIYNTLSSSIQLAGMGITALLTHDIFILIIVYAISGFLPNLIFYLRVLKLYKFEPMDEEEKKAMLRFSGHLSFMHILSGMAQYIDKIVIFHYLGSIQLAVYGLALAIPERAKGYLKSVSSIIMPKLTEKTIHDIHISLYKRVFQGMLIGAVISATYIILAPTFYKIFLPKYLEAVTYSQVFSLTLIFILPAIYMSGIFNAHKMVRTLYLSSSAGSMLKIVLYFFLGRLYGVWGVIASILIVYIAGTIYNFYLLEMEFRRDKA